MRGGWGGGGSAPEFNVGSVVRLATQGEIAQWEASLSAQDGLVEVNSCFPRAS